MSATFDPYFKWLGIPANEQPPNHYRLLGIPLLTSDPDVIESAADQRMAHLRSFQNGSRAAVAQRILNEVSAAKVCLLDKKQKYEYDQQFAPAPVQLSVPDRTRKPHKDNFVLELAKIVGGGVAGLVFGYLLISFFLPGFDPLGLFTEAKAPPVVEVKQQSAPVQPPVVLPKPVVVKPEPKPVAEPEPLPPPPEPKPEPVKPEVPEVPVKPEITLESQLDENLKSVADKQEVADELATLLERAVKEFRFDLSEKHVGRLLLLARSLDNSELERRAALVYLRKAAKPRTDYVLAELPKATPKPEPKPQQPRLDNKSLEDLMSVLPKSARTQVTPSGVLSLDCKGVELTEGHWATIGQLRTIRTLIVPQTRMNDTAVGKLVALPLTNLEAWSCDLGDDGLVHLGKMQSLIALNLEGNGKITDAGVVHLANCRNLSDLALSWSAVTDDGLRSLVNLPLKHLALNNTAVTDEGLVHVARIRTLRQLSVVGTKVTDNGAAKLKAILPQCNVTR